jgi:hypothetical protein
MQQGKTTVVVPFEIHSTGKLIPKKIHFVRDRK